MDAKRLAVSFVVSRWSPAPDNLEYGAFRKELARLGYQGALRAREPNVVAFQENLEKTLEALKQPSPLQTVPLSIGQALEQARDLSKSNRTTVYATVEFPPALQGLVYSTPNFPDVAILAELTEAAKGYLQENLSKAFPDYRIDVANRAFGPARIDAVEGGLNFHIYANAKPGLLSSFDVFLPASKRVTG